MKIVFCSLLACFTFTSAYCDGPRFHVNGAAKKVVSWNNETTANPVKGTLACGGEISISTHANALLVRVKHGNSLKELTVYTDDEWNDIEIGVYEYDFDRDGTQEIIVVDAPDLFLANVHVFRYSGGLAELVGNFSGQEFIELEENRINLPYGSQGLSMEYLYRDGAFYELVFHDPNN